MFTTSSPPSALAMGDSVSATSQAMAVVLPRRAPGLSNAVFRSKNCPSASPARRPRDPGAGRPFSVV
jgi:hypothetical protein